MVIGEAELRRGRPRQAASHLVAALTLFREIGDRAGEAYALGNLGGVDLRQGRHQAAARQQEQALALFREIADQAGEASALNGLGSVLLASGRAGDARARHAAALAVATQIKATSTSRPALTTASASPGRHAATGSKPAPCMPNSAPPRLTRSSLS